MTIYLKEDEVKDYFDTQTVSLREKGYTEVQISGILSLHYTKDTIIKYSEEEQDLMLDYWLKIILEVEGGYWQVQELINQPHSEFTHYSMRDMKSYERGNISKQMAKRELNADQYEVYAGRLEKAKVYKLRKP